MLKRALILLMVATAVILPGTAMAEQAPAPYPAAFWLSGQLSFPEGDPGGAGYNVVFFKPDANGFYVNTGFAFAQTAATGQFRVNLLDDLNLLPLQPSSATNKYYVGVAALDGWGVNATEMIITQADLDNGYRTTSLTLAQGAGIQDPVGGNISVNVNAASAGNPPIGAATVAAQTAGLSGNTNAEGFCLLSLVPAGTHIITAAAANFIPNSTSVTLTQAIINANATAAAAIFLTPIPAGKAVIYGYVRDNFSTYLAGVQVVAGALSTLTNTEGFYSLVVEPGTDYTLTASHAGYINADAMVASGLAGSSTQANITLTALPGTGAIAGTITNNATQVPIAFAAVTDGTRSTFSTATGTYVLAGVPAGEHTLHASANGYQTNSAAATVAGGATTPGINIALNPLNANQGEIHGYVRSASGNPLPLAAIIPILAGAPQEGSNSGADGWYQISLMASPQTYTIRASLATYQSQDKSVNLSAGDSTALDFALQGSAGFVPLTIERVGADVRISWDNTVVDNQNPRIFAHLSGNGTGQFTPDPADWPEITAANSAANNFNFGNYNNGTVLHTGQIGGGLAEAYYKAINGNIIDNAQKDVILPTAPAVGKVNTTLYKTAASGWNFIASPLANTTLNLALGTDFTAGDQLWQWNDAAQNFSAPVTFGGGSWGGMAGLERGRGYLFNLTGTSPKTITMIGNVDATNFSRAVSVSAGTSSYGWNLISSPVPTALTMNGLVGGKSVAGDALWAWDNETQSFGAPLVFNGAAWPAGTQMAIGRAYGYNHVGPGFNWTIP